MGCVVDRELAGLVLGRYLRVGSDARHEADAPELGHPSLLATFRSSAPVLLSLLPLGLGGTCALVDKNSRAFSDILLRITWRTE